MGRQTARLLAACFSLLAMSSLHAQVEAGPGTAARLDAVANAYTPDDAFMGVVLVARGDDILLNRGYGKADLEWGIPNAPDVKFRLGSLTKQFTAALVLLLQEDGRLKLTDAVGKYLSRTFRPPGRRSRSRSCWGTSPASRTSRKTTAFLPGA